jgi:hypothetical protein
MRLGVRSERLRVDDGAHEVREVAHVAHADRGHLGPTRSRSCGQRLDGAYTREAAEHFCPWYSNEPRTIAVASASTSQRGGRG